MNNLISTTKDHIAIAIGYELSKLRKLRNLSGKKLAEMIDISQQQISRYERGTCRINTDTLVYLLYKLGTSLDDFFIGVSLRLKEIDPELYKNYRFLFYPLTRDSYKKYFKFDDTSHFG
ncbi:MULTISPECIES: helix-turn-helix domain-containing protein [unclassified Providencia]|uniref:helix-turn-helix domain-containing protein n=1 Tax=unclassified Providencia TaxID=2633465 RepID=UPI000E8B0799|nr:helix-turn-helix transcriptional regulator [Providencia sp.]HBO24273.1 XRE family transcriptional regulator [Providencia sp.]